MSLDAIVLEMVVEEFIDGLMAQMNAQVLALFLDAPRDQRFGDVLDRGRRRIHQRAQDQVAVAAPLRRRHEMCRRPCAKSAR